MYQLDEMIPQPVAAWGGPPPQQASTAQVAGVLGQPHMQTAMQMPANAVGGQVAPGSQGPVNPAYGAGVATQQRSRPAMPQGRNAGELGQPWNLRFNQRR